MTCLHPLSHLFLAIFSTTLLLHSSLYNASDSSPPTNPAIQILSSSYTSSYIIHTDNSSRPSNFISQSEWYTSLIQSLLPSETSHNSTTARPGLLYTYRTALHGFSAVLTQEQAEKISNSPGVIGVYKDKLVQLHTTHTPNFVRLNTEFGIWKDSNFGDDVIIGLIDTGIWPESQSFNDSGLRPVNDNWRGQCEDGYRFNSTMCNNKLIGARFFLAGMEAMMPKDNNEHMSARDLWGHGTHTASTAAGSVVPDASFYGFASGTARGIAPNAKIAMYKVCWTRFGCTQSDILAGIEKSIEDGVHILSISLGYGNLPYERDPISIGTFSAVRHGIFVACSAGNEGPSLSSVHNSAPWVTTVAAGSADRSFLASVTLGSGEMLFGESLYFQMAQDANMLPITSLENCNPDQLVSSNVMGKIVICRDAFVGTGFYIQAAGGAGLISINGDSSRGETVLAMGFTLPALSVGYLEGEKLISYSNSTKNPVARLAFMGTVIGKTRAPKVASYSSRGPNSQMPNLLKPDILAPGTNILAAWPSETPLMGDPKDPRRSDFNILSGTSMACPHVAGTAALLKNLHPDWSPSMIRSAMMTTAFNLDNRYRPIINNTSPDDRAPLAIGSGHVFPQAASDPGLVYESGFEDYLNWLCTMNYTSNQMKKFVSWPVNCTGIFNDKNWDLNYPSFAVSFNNRTRDEVVRTRTLTKVSKYPESYRVRVENIRPDKVEIMVSPDILEFEGINEKRSYMVQFKSKNGFNKPDTEYEYAYIIWENEEHQVKSPVVFMWNYV